MNFSVLFLATLALFIGTAGWGNAGIITYDPTLGTLPQNQGFTFEASGPASPAPTVVGGILNQGPTTQTGLQYWERSDIPLDFSGGFFSMEVTLRVVSSSYGQGGAGAGTARAGYGLDATDALGHTFALGIAATGVFVNTDLNGSITNGIPFIPFDTTTGFHAYLLTVQGGTGKLFIDGAQVGSTPIGAAVDPSSSDLVYFGDGTLSGNSQTQLALFQYTNTASTTTPPSGGGTSGGITSVPEPTSLSLFGMAGLSLLGYIWRRRKWRMVELRL